MKVPEMLKKNFDTYIDVPLKLWEGFVGLGEIIEVEQNTIIKEANAIEKYLYFIIKGSGGILLWNNANFVCMDLCYEGDFFGDYMSFVTRQKSPLEVVVFEPSQLLRIPHHIFDDLDKENNLNNRLFQIAAEALFVHKQQQQIDLLTKTATERYTELLIKQPHIIQRTQQKYIASHLGITPQSLSRIRAEI